MTVETLDAAIEKANTLNTAFRSWLAGYQAIVNKYYTEMSFSNPPTITYEEGKKYYRIVMNNVSGRSATAFIDKTSGDVLKSASWKAPAKHARGNIFDDHNGLAKMGPYGPAYLRG